LSYHPGGGGSFFITMDTEHYKKSDYYKDLAEEVIEEHVDLQWLWNVRIDYMTSTKTKTSQGMAVYGECIKVKEWMQVYIPHDFVIVIYEVLADHLPREVQKRLLHHELLHIGSSEKDGELIYKTNPHDVQDFRAIINEYGLDWING